MNKVNYQKELDKTIENIKESDYAPTLLLHSCCAPCSSYCLEYLSQYFRVTVLYYNPNIFPKDEYIHRVEEQKRFIEEFNELAINKIEFVEGRYEPDRFYDAVKGHEEDPEGGDRCTICFRLRLGEAADMAAKLGCDYFTTTLSISPLKDSERLNTIGCELSGEYGVKYLLSDFKKRNGYKRSTELSREYGMYRQDFCGCVFSKLEREKYVKENSCGN